MGEGKFSFGCIKFEVTIKHPGEDVKLSAGYVSLDLTSQSQAKKKLRNCVCV